MYKKILHGMDGSEGAFKALKEAIDIARLHGAELHSVSVQEVPHYAGTIGEVMEEEASSKAYFNEIAAGAREIAQEAGVDLHVHVIVGHEAKTIIEMTKKFKFDLLVLGFMGRSALYDRVMGSTCQNLVRLAPCSVLVVK
ncbi:MAG: universal stress protein [Syntrophaceae bacterium]|nr:universal stress protein [Syntrophaceae bacterium]